MKEQSQQLFWIPERGITITLPPDLSNTLSHDAINNQPFKIASQLELRVISEDSILKKRYPRSILGNQLMDQVDFDRRLQLLDAAKTLSQQIVECWDNKRSGRDIAIILYGSIARGVVKNRFVKEPSDIDLAIIGEFTEQEGLDFREEITPYREKILRELIAQCPNSPEEYQTDLRYAGTMVQPIGKLMSNKYSAALNYIASCATPIYDPVGIWQRLKQEAISCALSSHGKYKNLVENK